ncbi:MAG: AzlD domain-containing protein [Pseudomonadota bacterium]
MSVDHWLLIALLAGSTVTLRLVGYLAGAAMMARPFWRRLLEVFPGCLMTALVASALADGGVAEIIAALAALVTAILTRQILATMGVGMAVFVIAGQMLG